MPASFGLSSLHVIESLGESFNEPGKELIERLQKRGGTIAGIPMTRHVAFGRAEVFDALRKIYADEAKLGLAPVLHFEAHGDAVGLLLRDGSYLLWGELADRLRAFNLATRFNLLVVLACCHGIHQIKALKIHEACPFSAVVGCQGEIRTSELLNGFERFYEILINEGKALRAESALQDAVVKSDGTRFKLFSCEYGFETVCASVIKAENDPMTRGARIEFYRKELDRMKALNGNLTQSTTAEIDSYLRQAHDKTMRDFYRAFFAIADVPENLSRFPLDKMLARAAAAN